MTDPLTAEILGLQELRKVLSQQLAREGLITAHLFRTDPVTPTNMSDGATSLLTATLGRVVPGRTVGVLVTLINLTDEQGHDGVEEDGGSIGTTEMTELMAALRYVDSKLDHLIKSQSSADGCEKWVRELLAIKAVPGDALSVSRGTDHVSAPTERDAPPDPTKRTN